MDAAGLEVDDEQDHVADQPGQREHFDAEEIRRRDGPEMRFEKRVQDVVLPREGAGSRPYDNKMRLTVLRPSWCPRLPSAPRRRV
jgi:hypothetical protein